MTTTEAPSSWELARSQGESLRDGLDEYAMRLAAADDANDYEAREEIEQEIREDPLEMYAAATRVAGESDWEVQTVTVVLGTGGPHVEAVYSDTDSARLHVYWGSEWSCTLDTDVAATFGAIWGVDLMFEGES